MHAYRFRCNRSPLTVDDIRALRTVCSLSIKDIRRIASQNKPLIELTPVSKRGELEALCSAIEAGMLPLDVYEFSQFPGLSASDKKLSTSQFRVRLDHLQQIATETAIDIDREEGEE